MDALIKSVIRKYNIPDSAVEEYSNGAVSISFDSLQEADEIYRVFLRKKRLHVELHIYSWAVTVQDRKLYEEQKEQGSRMKFLTDMFFLKMHDGASQEDAKAEQEKYCNAHPEYWDAYHSIYA